MRKQILALILICMGNMAVAQKLPRDMIKDFLLAFDQNKVEEALDGFYAQSPYMSSEASDVKSLKLQLTDFIQKLGGYNGSVLLGKKSVKDCYEIYVFLAKFDRQPVRFTFQFYKPKDTWVSFAFSYDTEVDTEFEKALDEEISRMYKE